jgi:hypothetical protein
MAEAVDDGASQISETVHQVATLAIVVLIVLVGIGIAVDSPGGLIAYLLVVVPPLLGATIHIVRKERAGTKLSWYQRFTTLLVSGVVMMGLLVAIAVALIAILFTICLGAVMTGQF